MDDEFEDFSTVSVFNNDLGMFQGTDRKEIGGAERWIDMI
jgi:hypothetical protein